MKRLNMRKMILPAVVLLAALGGMCLGRISQSVLAAPAVSTNAQYNAGMDAMRQVAIDSITSWQMAKWAQESSPDTLSKDDVHAILGGVGSDIMAWYFSHTPPPKPPKK
jgi:hypothetical protein